MTIIRHADSHLDHSLTEAHVAFVLGLNPAEHGDPTSPVRVFTVELPDTLGSLPCNLYGPLMGDDPVLESEVSYHVRGERKGKSRMIDGKSPRPSRLVSVVAGPHDGRDWVLFTAYGGPLMPREPFEDDSEATRILWEKHALSL